MLCEIYTKCRRPLARLTFSVFAVFVGLCAPYYSQSTEQNSPTPVTSKQVSGQIPARDIGDSRLTTYFYAFNGKRGDVFMNIVTNNFNGVIDVFTVEGLEPRTKITVYADSSDNETGRVIYMRKPERLLLRIQGRTPNDDPASFLIKFAGSFDPLEAVAANEDSKPTVTDAVGEGTVKVNSVGTIIEDPPKVETKAELKLSDVAAVDKSDDKPGPDILDGDEKPDVKTDSGDQSKSDKKSKTEPTDKVDIPSTFDPTRKPEKTIEEAASKQKPLVVVVDPFKDAPPEGIRAKDVTVDLTKKPKKATTLITIERVPDNAVEAEERDPKNEALEKAEALKRIRLIIELKDGKKFEKRMSKVSSFNVFDGVLKVVGIDGKVTKFSILDVAKITIQ